MIISEIPKSIHSKEKVQIICDVCKECFERRYDASCASFSNHKKYMCTKCCRKYVGSLKIGIKRDKSISEKGKLKHAETIKNKYPSFTINCKCCNVEFTVPYRHRDRLYCGRSCQSKSIVKTDIRTTSTCLICKKEFKHYGERVLCSRKCMSKYFSISRIGENNPSFKNENETKKCLSCKKDFEYKRNGMCKGSTRVFCSLACSHNIDLKNQPLSGIVKQYPFGWNRELKEAIKNRDNFECQLCGLKDGTNKQKHHIHHIDYDKTNLDHNNLITLCQKCHNMTHNGRTFWEIIFSGLLSGSTIVKKSWGAEIHIVNHNDYCLKYLIFFKGQQFSYHYHLMKKELWHCVYGKLECVMENNYFIINQGDKVEIQPNIKHQVQAIRNSILIEVSTRSYTEDSIRTIEAIN